jgi:hypothetical protein
LPLLVDQIGSHKRPSSNPAASKLPLTGLSGQAASINNNVDRYPLLAGSEN